MQARGEGEGGKRGGGGGQDGGEFLKGGFLKGVPSSALPSLTPEEGDPTADIEKVLSPPSPLPFPPGAHTPTRTSSQQRGGLEITQVDHCKIAVVTAIEF